MKRFKLVLLTELVAVFLIAGKAFARWQGGQAAQRMVCQERFDALDTNHDGKLTLEEFMAVPYNRGNAGQMFKAMDVNGHGYITKEEFCSGQGMGRRGRGRGIGQGQEGEAGNADKKEKEIQDKKVDDAIKKAWEEK
jgi:hypothetical protein